MEVIFKYTPVTGSKTGTLYYDGTTETNNNSTTVANEAAYIETPGKTLTFDGAVAATVFPQTFSTSPAKAGELMTFQNSQPIFA